MYKRQNEFYVENCSFNGLKEAISMYGDGTLMKNAIVSGNTFNNCSFALHGYYGGSGDAGTLSFVNNTVNGTDDLLQIDSRFEIANLLFLWQP